MGPAAWVAVGRALAAATATGVFLGRGGVVRVVAEQVSAAVQERDFKLAEAMLRDMRRNHKSHYEEFLRTYGSELPPELWEDFR